MVARINDGRILREFAADLQKVPTRGLLDYLRYLDSVSATWLAFRALMPSFAARADNQRYKAAFDKILGQFTLSQCGIIGARIAKIYDLAEIVDVKIAYLFSAPSTTKRPSLPVLKQLPRVEGPSIGALDIDTSLPSLPGGAIHLLQKSSTHDLCRPPSSVPPAALLI